MLFIHNKRAYRIQPKRNIANILQCLQTIGRRIDLVQLDDEFAIRRRLPQLISKQLEEKSGRTLPTRDQRCPFLRLR